MFSHIAATNDLHHYLHRVERTLKSAGLEATLNTSREDSWVKLTEILENDHTTNLSAIDRLIASFTQPYRGMTTISLPSTRGKQIENIEITTQTFVGQFTLSAEHLVVLPPSLVKVLELDPDQPRQSVFSTTEEVQSYIDWLLTLDISRSSMAKEYMGRAHSKTQAPSVSITSASKAKGLEKEDEVSIVLENGLLTISAAAESAAGSFLETGTAGETFIWDGTPGKATLVEKVRSWIK
jgi:mediator of RNA polymerase II transcription subunit 17